jgi:glycerol-3-phosphate acyltransferase PlsY
MIVENFYFNTAIILLASYLIGAFPSAYIAGKIKGINISKTGSGNVGGMNTFSSVGKIAGVIVALTDAGKGFLVAYLASMFSG